MIIYGNLRAPRLRYLQHLLALKKQGVDTSGDEFSKSTLELEAFPDKARVRELVPSKPLLILRTKGRLSDSGCVETLVRALLSELLNDNPSYAPATGVGISLAIFERQGFMDDTLNYSIYLTGALYNALPRPRSLYWTSVLKYARQGLDV